MKNFNTKKAARILIALCLAVTIVCALSLLAFASNEEVAEVAAAEGAMASAAGLGYIAAALSVGIAGVGSGIAVAAAAPAAIGALTEDPKTFGKSIVFVAMSEGMALYGMLISILILTNL